MGISAYATTVLANGTEKRIEDLDVGDSLREPLTGHETAVRKHWRGPGVGMFRIVTENGAIIDLTADHKILTAQGVMPVAEVRPGTVLQCMGSQAICTEASALLGDFMVYDIALEGVNPSGIQTLSANGFIVGDMFA